MSKMHSSQMSGFGTLLQVRKIVLLTLIAGCGRIGFAALGAMPDGASSDALDAQVTALIPPSCIAQTAGADHRCGAAMNADCCGSFEIPLETFARDGNAAYPATVSGFRLDAFLVTVGRFRPFVAATAAGWVPADGAGTHTHVNSGRGLANSGLAGGLISEAMFSTSGGRPTMRVARSRFERVASMVAWLRQGAAR